MKSNKPASYIILLLAPLLTFGHSTDSVTTDTATFAGGCFWCVEAQFQMLSGVERVIPGYTGGETKHPTYRQVSTGATGHAEAVNVVYDNTKISYGTLLKAFFTAHDPTQLNRQGNDIGTQYRSAIFYHNDRQRATALYYINRLNQQNVYPSPIVTTVEPFTKFYEAEPEHINYYKRNPDAAYCRVVISPKIEKFRKVFEEELKQQD